MAIPTNPELLKMPFAADGDKNSIPETTSPTTGLFSQQYGFQPINSLPLTAGGKAISRLDWNGCMYMLSNLLYYMQRGYTFVYDDDMPYVQGCRVLDPNDGQVYNCVVDVAAGVGAPSVTPANWELAPSADVLGFRKPSTEYAVGDIAYSPSLPTGWYLECTTAGTTDSGDLSISSSTIGDTVTDGTVTWTINCSLPLVGGGALTGNNLTWNGDDLGGSAIVAKSIGRSGYIKYASGLIIQWGYTAGTLSGTWTFPISFNTEPSMTVTVISSSAAYASVFNVTATQFDYYSMTGSSGSKFYIAIGY